jgi:hypothetical protein
MRRGIAAASSPVSGRLPGVSIGIRLFDCGAVPVDHEDGVSAELAVDQCLEGGGGACPVLAEPDLGVQVAPFDEANQGG